METKTAIRKFARHQTCRVFPSVASFFGFQALALSKPFPMLFASRALPAQLPPPELLSPDEMARADAEAIGRGIPGIVLMEHAGRAVARAAVRCFGPSRTVVFCGPGNNGGDGYVAARRLAEMGWPVAVAALAPPRPGSDAALAAALWNGKMLPFSAETAKWAELAIDAVFGAGLARDVDPAVLAALQAAPRVLAVDVPSGVDGATGEVRGGAPQAAVTVTFFRFKPGHFLLPGRDLCGQCVLADIGIPADALTKVAPRTFLNHPGLWQLPARSATSHKYSFGHVTVLAGAAMTGAARLAALAARRAGAGLVTLAAGGAGDIFRAGEPGTIVSDAPLATLLQDARRNVWVCGPGLGAEAARAALPALIGAARAVVADADVFTAFAGEPQALRGATVLTPHAGEFARVFGALPADRLAAVRGAAQATGAVVVLKGSDTLIAAPDGRVAINASAPPSLATAGTGDVLAGTIAGLLASGMESFAAAAAGVWLHGRAAALAGKRLIAEDLLTLLPHAMEEADRLSALPLPLRSKAR
jgi:hydroxyethylthiazole kinase-like uncharacterized protein yjeF